MKSGNAVTLIENKTSNDSSLPNYADVGSDLFRNCSKVKVYVTVGGSGSPSWDVYPLIGSESLNAFYKGSVTTVSEGNTVFQVNVNAPDKLYFYCDNQSGTSPTITLSVERLD